MVVPRSTFTHKGDLTFLVRDSRHIFLTVKIKGEKDVFKVITYKFLAYNETANQRNYGESQECLGDISIFNIYHIHLLTQVC